MKYIKIHPTKMRIVGALFVLAVVAQGLVPFLVPHTAALGTLTNTIVRFDRLAQSTFTSGTVCAKPATVGVESTVAVTFPTGFTVSGTTANWGTTLTGTAGVSWPTGAVAWLTPGGAGSVGSTATSSVGQTVTWNSSDLTVGTLYCFNWTNTTTALQTGTAAAYTGTVATNLDTGTYAVTTVGAGADQITVTATVNAIFSMALSATTDPLGTLSIASVTPSGTPRTATINTNAVNGWYAWAEDSQQGLHSTTASYNINSNATGSAPSCAGTNATLAAGTEGYNLGITQTQASGTGTVTVATPFVGGSLGKGGGLCSVNFQSITSSNGTAGNAVLTLTNNAAISGATKAATDYSDIETFVGSGIF